MQQLDLVFEPAKNVPGLFMSPSGEFMLTSRPQRQPGTREVHLTDLGKFPLSEQDIPLLQQKITYQQNTFWVPDILLQSNIPLFYREGERYPIYIPRPGVAICRYFASLWAVEGDELTSLLNGFLVIDSFVGGRE